jgi:peptidoglycan/LPS O-acetylase OafA/YrhL
MKRLELLDYGRFIAALCVVAHHYLFNGILTGKVVTITQIPFAVEMAKYGYLGVEFFFIISGYVIFFSANHKSAGDFLTSRAVRLFPAFWVAVLFTSSFAYFMGGDRMAVEAPQVIANLTMFPGMLGYSFVDGVYWTLQYEWKFYLAVFALLAFGLQDKLTPLFMLWPVAILFAKLTGFSELPYMGGYYCYFAAGCLFALRRQNPTRLSLAALLLCFYLCLTTTIERASLIEMANGVHYADTLIAVVITSFFVFFTFINSAFGSRIRLPGSRWAGALTYPLYLIHAHVGYMLLNRFATEDNKLWVSALCLIFVLLASYLIHLFAELKPATFWQQLFSRTLGVCGDALQRWTLATTSLFYRQLQLLCPNKSR